MWLVKFGAAKIPNRFWWWAGTWIRGIWQKEPRTTARERRPCWERQAPLCVPENGREGPFASYCLPEKNKDWTDHLPTSNSIKQKWRTISAIWCWTPAKDR